MLRIRRWYTGKGIVFQFPEVLQGKAFIREITRLFLTVGEASTLELIALKAVFVASA